MTKRISATIEQEREFHPHAVLWHASRSMLEAGQTAPKANAHHFLSSFVLTMFTLEAYLNERGIDLHRQDPAKIPVYEAFERCGPREKIEWLYGQLRPGSRVAWGKEPLQPIARLISLRNAVVHPKHAWLRPGAREVSGSSEAIDRALGAPLRAQFEAAIHTDDFARIARDAVQALLTEFHALEPKPSFGLFVLGFTSFHATIRASDERA